MKLLVPLISLKSFLQINVLVVGLVLAAACHPRHTSDAPDDDVRSDCALCDGRVPAGTTADRLDERVVRGGLPRVQRVADGDAIALKLSRHIRSLASGLP